MNPTPIAHSSSSSTPARAFRAAADLYETATHLQVRCNLPGVAAENIQLSIEGRLLTVSGTPESGPLPDGKALIEYPTGSWKRSLKLHCDVDVDNIRAQTRNGVLDITLPKLSPAGPRRIAVTSGPETTVTTPG